MGTIIAFASARARMQGPDLTTSVATFLADLRSDGRSERTIGGHQGELTRYAAWLEEQSIDWASASPADLASYARTRSHRGPSSRASLVISMRVFHAWAADPAQGPLIARNPAERLKTPKRAKAAPRALNAEQIRTLLVVLADEHQRQPGARMERDRALIITALYTGMRAQELAALHWSDLELQTGIATVRKGKGAKGRSMRLRPDFLPILRSWRLRQNAAPDSAVFALNGVAVVPNRVGKIVHRYALLTGLPLTAHVLRHTFATTALRNSGNLYSVSRALGHAQLQQTMVYVRGDPSDSDAAIESLPGLNDW